MPAYLMVEVHIDDPVAYQEYIRQVPPTIELYGGRYLARGGATTVLEGDAPPMRRAIVEFPSVERAREWWASSEYAPAKQIRQACARATLVLIEGIGGAS